MGNDYRIKAHMRVKTCQPMEEGRGKKTRLSLLPTHLPIEQVGFIEDLLSSRTDSVKKCYLSLRAPVGQQPGHEIGLGVRPVPRIMRHAVVLGVLNVEPGRLQCLEHPSRLVG